MTRFSQASRAKWLACAFGALLTGGLAVSLPVASAQDTPKPKGDGALEDLLKELKKAPTPEPTPPTKEKVEKPEPKKPADTPTEKPKAAESPKPEVDSKDRALDSLLEKLGATVDEPTPEAPKRGTPPPDTDKKDPDQEKEKTPGQPDASEPQGGDKKLDEHLEELTGRRRKKKDQQGEEGGALSEVIKEMRDVEQRLGKTDTGEETRKKQQQIVKNLETLIEEMRASQGKPQKKQQQVAMQKGQQQGQDPGQNPGANASGAPGSKPERPTGKRVLAGGKDEWGHLPPELRQELENVFKEEPLPAMEELIRRYYLSVAKKSLKRGD